MSSEAAEIRRLSIFGALFVKKEEKKEKNYGSDIHVQYMYHLWIGSFVCGDHVQNARRR
jgi:hypothetical protein